MKAEKLSELVSQLTPEEQAAVRKFIEFIKSGRGGSPQTRFLSAVDDFISEHPELLRRLAE